MSTGQETGYTEVNPYLPLVVRGSGKLILALLAIILMAHGAGLMLGDRNAMMVGIFQGGTIAACAAGLFSVGRQIAKSRDSGRSSPAPLFFAVALTLILASTTAAIAGLVPETSWLTTSGLLGAIAFASAGAFSLPSRKLAGRQKVAALFDVGTVVLTGTLGFWLFGLNHGKFARSGLWPHQFMLTVAMIVSLVMAVGLLLTVLRLSDDLPLSAIAGMAVGTVILVVVEIFPLCFALSAGSGPPAPNHLGWSLFAISIALGSHSIRHSQTDEREWHSEATVAVPYAATCLIGLLLFTSVFVRDVWVQNMAVLLPVLFTALALVVGRQTFVASERSRMVKDLTVAKNVAERANDSRLHFLANISHDLRTPLNGILGCTQIMLRDNNVTKKQTELLKTTKGCTEHLQNLINDLLDMSKLESGRLDLAPCPFDLRALLFELTRTFTIQAEAKKIHLDVETPDDLPPWITCDRKRLRQVLGNLVNNAIKFTDVGSVTVHVERDGANLLFAVRDSGCGIHPDRIDNLFKPYQPLDEKSLQLEGTGLGLSISKKLAQKMGGDIEVESVLGQGSIFRVTIPLEEAEPVQETQRTVVDYKGLRRRILIVDDKASNRVVLRSMLEGIEFLIDEAESGAAALELVERFKPDVAILDLMMPGMDGLELCRRIHEKNTGQPPICFALSAMAGDYILEQTREAGFKEFLRKPLTLELLLDALRKHADIEWVYGVFKPDPSVLKLGLPEKPVKIFPEGEQLEILVDMARRGFVKNIEAHLEELEANNDDLRPFADKARSFLTDFKLKELVDWLSSLTTLAAAHG